MITNRSPFWVCVMAEIEADTMLSVVDSHITSEFLEATLPCESSPAGGGGINASTDPFYLTPAQQSALHARSTLRNGAQPWGTPIDNGEPCPTCGRRPWWAEQDQNPQWWEDDEEDDKSERDDFLDEEI
jgi:hypothetical protein